MASMKTIFAYLLYALLATVLLLYLRFPGEAVKAYLDQRLAAVDPALALSAETIAPAIPPGLKMTGVDLTREGARIVRFDKIRVSPHLRTLVQKNKKVRFQSQVAQGTIDGWAIIEGNGAGHLQAEADLSEIRLDRLDPVQAEERFSLTGTLGGQVNHDDGRGSGEKTTATLTISDVAITLAEEFFGIRELVVGQVNATVSTNGENLRVKSLDFDGPMVQGKITGTIELRQPLGQSRLNLTGNASPRPALFARLQESIPQGIFDVQTLGSRGLNFRVRGSIDNPQVSMR